MIIERGKDGSMFNGFLKDEIGAGISLQTVAQPVVLQIKNRPGRVMTMNEYSNYLRATSIHKRGVTSINAVVGTLYGSKLQIFKLDFHRFL